MIKTLAYCIVIYVFDMVLVVQVSSSFRRLSYRFIGVNALEFPIRLQSSKVNSKDGGYVGSLSTSTMRRITPTPLVYVSSPNHYQHVSLMIRQYNIYDLLVVVFTVFIRIFFRVRHFMSPFQFQTLAVMDW